MTKSEFVDEPTEDDLAAIAAIIFSNESETIQIMPADSPWAVAGRREAVEKWEQLTRLSRIGWNRND